MARRFPSPVRFILLLALIAVIVFWWKSRQTTEPFGEKTQLQKVGWFEESLVEEVLFEGVGGSLRVIRKGEDWWIVEPYSDLADRRFLAQSLRVASSLLPERTLPDTARALFGLTRPAATWTCRWDGGEFTILLGDTLPAGAGRFAQTSVAPEVLVIDGFLARRYLAPPHLEIHEPIAARLDVGRIDSVSIETREEKIRVVRQRGGRWVITEPLQVAAAGPAMNRAINALRSESMIGFLGPVEALDLSKLGLDPPRAVWRLVQGGRRETVRIGHPTPDQRSVHIIPSGRDVVGLISSESFRIWVDGMTRLRWTGLVATSVDSVLSIELRGPERVRRFTRPPQGFWREIGEDGEREIRFDAFERAIENLCASHAIRFLSPRESDPFHPSISLFLGQLSGETDTLQFALPEGKEGWLRSSLQPGTAVIPRDAYRTWELWLTRPLRP